MVFEDAEVGIQAAEGRRHVRRRDHDHESCSGSLGRRARMRSSRISEISTLLGCCSDWTRPASLSRMDSVVEWIGLMSQLRIVLVMIDPPSTFGNATAWWFYVLLKGLRARGHHVTAFAACPQPDDLARLQALFPAPTYDLRLYPVPSRSGWHFQWQRRARPYSFLFSEELLNDLNGTLALGLRRAPPRADLVLALVGNRPCRKKFGQCS